MNIIKAINSYGKIFNIGDKVRIYNADKGRERLNNRIMLINSKTECNGGCRAWAKHNGDKCYKTSPKYCYDAIDYKGNSIHSCYCEMEKYK